MRCDNCGSTDTYIKNHEHIYQIKGKEIKFNSDRKFCSKCNNLVYDEKLDNIASEKGIEIYNKLYGVTKEEIIALRKKYNLSQELFSKVIGCAKKTLISYEKGVSIPNDSYLILIKILIANPEIIANLVEANKIQFTNKEYNKIKVYNMIIFLADNTILKTKLLKEMFYADFLFYKENCKSITGLEYCKLPFGPVPDRFETILSKGYQEDIIDYKPVITPSKEYYEITSKKKFNKDLFTKEELEVLDKIKKYFKNYNAKEIVEYSHKEKAFIDTNKCEKISYDYSFDIDLK